MEKILLWLLILIGMAASMLIAYALCCTASKADEIIEYQYLIKSKESSKNGVDSTDKI